MELQTVNITTVTDELKAWDQAHKHEFEGLDGRTTNIFSVHDPKQTIMYMATQMPLVLGPFVVNPALDEKIKAMAVSVALKEIFVVTRLLCQQNGLPWQVVFTQDEAIKKFAEKMGMERMPEIAYRRSTSD